MSTPPTLPNYLEDQEEESSQGWIIGAIAGGIILLILCVLLATQKPKNVAKGTDGTGGTGDKGKQSGSPDNTDKSDGKKQKDSVDSKSEKPDKKAEAKKQSSKTSEKEESKTKTKNPNKKDSNGSTKTESKKKLTGDLDVENSSSVVLGGLAKDTVSFFDIETESGNVVFVLDKSSSMSGERIERVKKELVKTIKPLRKTTKFHVIMFDDLAFQVTPKSMPATPSNKRKLENDLRNVFGSGSTNPVPAVELAILAKPDAIFILSDGEFPSGSVSSIKSLNKSNIAIHTIGFANDAYSLKQIAKQNNGKYKFVKW